MAMSSNCCLNTLPPLPDPPSRTECEEKPWRRKSPKLVMGLACAIIGLEMAMPNIDVITHEASLFNNSKALASEMKHVSTKGSKWSDKRSCPPWILNSLETIVPENLPRPSAHRRWEAVAYDSLGRPIAKTIIVIKSKPGCFSM